MTTKARQLLDERFTLDARIGEGTFAEIYRATDTRTGAVVAVKTLRPEQAGNEQAIALFQQEGEIGSSLAHANVVRVLSYGETSGTYFIVMELVSGISLRRRMRLARRLSIGESLRIMRAVLRGLDAIHTAGYIHRDIKPQNILLEVDGTPKITDFGITLRAGGIRATDDGTTLGTAAYIAPEQAAGWEIGPQADLYAAGVVLYEMLTGQVPFPGDDPLEVMHQHMFETPRDPRALNPAVSPALAAVVLRALAKEPEARYASAQEMHDALAALQHDAFPLLAPRRATVGRKPTRTARVPSLTSFVGALMLAVLLLIFVLALVSSSVGADESPHHVSQSEEPSGIVVDQPATPSPSQYQAPVAAVPTFTPAPAVPEQTPVDNTAGVPTTSVVATPSPTPSPTATVPPTPSPSPSPSPTPSASPSPTPSPVPAPSPTATPPPVATPQPTEVAELQIAQVPVRTVSDDEKKQPVANRDDGDHDHGHHHKKKNKKESADSGDQTNDNARTDNESRDATQAVADSGDNDRRNWWKKRRAGKTEDVTDTADASEPIAQETSDDSGHDTDDPHQRKHRHGRG